MSFLLTLSFKRGANKWVIKRLSESKAKSRMTSNGIRSYVLMLFLRVFYMDKRQLWLPTTLNQPIADPVINCFDVIISALMGFAPKNGYVRPRGGEGYII